MTGVHSPSEAPGGQIAPAHPGTLKNFMGLAGCRCAL